MLKYRRKYFRGVCPKCKRSRKLELVGENEDQEIVWLRCSKCLESHSFPIEQVRKTGRVLTENEMERRKDAMSKVVEYSPEKTYWVGQKIHHAEFDDEGEVVKKEETAGNNHMIVVKFENKGTMKLVEGYES